MVDLLATTTNWDVFDDAVKIGLSALIGGLFAWLLARQKYSQDVNKEDRKHSQEIAKEDRAHRREALERLSAEFEQAHEDIWLGTALLTDGMKLGIQKLHAIEGQLMLFKLNDCAAVIDDYRSEVASVAAACSTMTISDFDAKFAQGSKSAAAKRLEFFELMGAAYS
jgi:hypothetical protein